MSETFRRRQEPGSGLRPATRFGPSVGQPVQVARVDGHEVQLARRVFAERGEAADGERLASYVDRLAPGHAQAPDRARAVVAVEVPPACGGDLLAAVDVAACDRAAV